MAEVLRVGSFFRKCKVFWNLFFFKSSEVVLGNHLVPAVYPSNCYLCESPVVTELTLIFSFML